jgi:inorganic triphosphatase YgiF
LTGVVMKKHKLRRHGLSLRVRHIGRRHVQTIKQDGGEGTTLLARKEWEQEISGQRPDIDAARDTALEPLLGKKAAPQIAAAVRNPRVALRRLRAAISLFADVLADRQTDEMKHKFKWITGELGPAREIDVFINRVVARRQRQARWSGSSHQRSTQITCPGQGKTVLALTAGRPCRSRCPTRLRSQSQ